MSERSRPPQFFPPDMRQADYDVGIIGAGPVGCVTALSFARKGARVLLLEANPCAARRLAGEWLHPPAVAILEGLGVDLVPEVPYATGRGFVVFPDDGSPPVVLPYPYGAFGFSCEHVQLVGLLRRLAAETRGVDYEPYARVKRWTDHTLSVERKRGGAENVCADLLVGACGRSAAVDAALGPGAKALTYSRMAGVLLEDLELPFEGYGHVIIGGPGPILAYRIDARRVRMCFDVPFALGVRGREAAALWDGFAPVVPASMRDAFRRALQHGPILWAANQDVPRKRFGREGFALVGDAVGHHHPLTGVGMTLGFQDGAALAACGDFGAYRAERAAAGRVPELLAVILYEVFADMAEDAVAIRRAIYGLWRSQPAERGRTMSYLSGQDSHAGRFSRTFVRTVALAVRETIAHGAASGRWAHAAELVGRLGGRVQWVLATSAGRRKSEPSARFIEAIGRQRARAKEAEHGAERPCGGPTTKASNGSEGARPKASGSPALSRVALEAGVDALLAEQAQDGSWEGEVVWCPMLAAQYVLTCYVTGTRIAEDRRRRLLRHFEAVRLGSGTWGLHELSAPYLFVTVLVYVAARILGAAPASPLLARAAEFIRAQGGAAAIPSWGKFWLALLNLYRWEGVNPVLPELWRMPLWLGLHPSRYYCHTRHIYLGMAAIYGAKYQVPCTPLIAALRQELYPQGYERIDFPKARAALRAEDLYVEPGPMLRAAYAVLRLLERRHSPERRARVLTELRRHIRYELRATAHTSLSPVSGLLNLLALWIADANDEDFRAGIESFEGWIWEDEENGARVAGARSATWDTAFAMQALAAASPHVEVERALDRGDNFLESQQIRRGTGREAEFFRTPPEGGYCFAGVWHGWPVSDCTAEVVAARLGMARPKAAPEALAAAVRFMLAAQNRDGGFGSYEARRVRLPLEWLNPAEMFGDSMTEMSYVECTASCLEALTLCGRRHPATLARAVEAAVARAARWLRLKQRPDGAWDASWGIHFIYGTLFGVRGLLAAGAVPQDPAIRRACAWLRARQRSDGGWGEHHRSALSGTYVENQASQTVQTSWALITLLAARDPHWEDVERGARFLSSTQSASGSWPKQDPEGIFFHTALLDYTLYRRYFPVWALALFESARKARLRAFEDDRRALGTPRLLGHGEAFGREASRPEARSL